MLVNGMKREVLGTSNGRCQTCRQFFSTKKLCLERRAVGLNFSVIRLLGIVDILPSLKTIPQTSFKGKDLRTPSITNPIYNEILSVS